MAKQPQDYQRPAKKRKKVDPHDPSESFSYTSPHTGIEITLPYIENLPTGAIRKASQLAGDDKMTFYFSLMNHILEDDFEDTIDPLLQRETVELIEKWESESATSPGESSAS